MKGSAATGHWADATMDASEPPRIVFETTTRLYVDAACVDAARTEEIVRQALEPARAPGAGWVVTIRLSTGVPVRISAEAEITDAAGTSRARKVAIGDTAECSALGSAMARWALDALRTEQPKEEERPPPPALPALPAVETPTPPRPTTAEPPRGPPSIHLSPPPARMPADATPPQEAPSEYEMPTLEAGMAGFFMVGGAAGGYAGVTPFLIDELAEGVFLRPSLGIGSALSVNVSSTWLAGRVDTCTRLPGRYATRNGIQLDLCGGPDVGFSYVSSGTQQGTPSEGKLLPYVAIGPSVDLRAEVGTLAVSLRAVSGFNVARKGFVDRSGKQFDEEPWSWRFELAFSTSLHRSSR
ncbi:MAG: hypothetical protein M3O50_21910 [Myxococcota bacterium]|nr:hypothetical protein [Myxococcota bacterium]